MAFVNKYLSDEEKKRFEEAKIENPVRFHLEDNLLKPSVWTVDEKKKIALVRCGIYDRENPEIETFAFINTDLKDDDILVFDIIQHSFDKEEDIKLKNKYNVDLVYNWELIKINNLDLSHVVSSKDEFLQILEEALTAYCIDGNPKKIYKTKVFIK